VEDRSVEPEFRNQATMMIGRLGKPGLAALPTLEKLLKEPPSDDGIPAVWSAKAIALLGPGARDATPILIEVLEDPATPIAAQLACLEALARIGGHHAKSIPAVVRTLKRASHRDLDAGDRALLMASIDAFSLLGSGASIAVPELMDLLDHPQELVRLKVVQALGAIGKPSSPAANSLAEMLIFDESDAVRKAAAFTLASMGPDAHQLLSQLARDEDVSVRKFSVEALGTISSRNEGLEQLLARALTDQAAEVRLMAAIALENDASKRTEVLQTFARLIMDRDRSVRLSAANHLSAMKPDDAEWEKLSAEIDKLLDRESRRLWERIERMRESRR
jgi:HEAT repeat protein